MTAGAPYASIGVIGAGAWGTALAQNAAKAGHEAVLWCRRKEQMFGISSRRENADYLPDVELDRGVRPTADLAEVGRCAAVLLVTPAQHARATLTNFRPHAPAGLPVIVCAKGVEQGSLKTIAEVAAEVLPTAVVGALSGPNFAREIGQGLPAVATLACPDREIGRRLRATIGRAAFRIYLTDDVVGTEVGGAVKNPLAIACGVVEGRRLGRNAHAALLTRGFAEMTRLGLSMGGRIETLMGPCGLGDLVLTCSSQESRNFSLGYSLGQGRKLTQILAERKGVTEGVTTAPALAALAKRRGVEMPIVEAIDFVLAGHLTVEDAIESLLARPFKEVDTFS